MAVETPAVNMDKLMAFLGQVIGELGATVNAGLIVIGDRLGLYKAMAGAGPITSTELAEKTRTSERYMACHYRYVLHHKRRRRGTLR